MNTKITLTQDTLDWHGATYIVPHNAYKYLLSSRQRKLFERGHTRFTMDYASIESYVNGLIGKSV